MSHDPLESAAVQRGLILVQQRLFAEAKGYLQQAVAENPQDSLALGLLATCHYHFDGERALALTTIERALALAPLDPNYHALRACILNSLQRPRQALQSAAQALQLDPACDLALTAESAAHLQLENWPEAERAARRALEIDPDDSDANNLLAEALRIQGRKADTAAQIQSRLARDPLDPWTHSTAGWAALQSGDRSRAEGHFVEALRLDPNLDAARSGLIEAFKARSWLYRGYLRWAFATSRLGPRKRWLLILGLYFAVRLVRATLTPVRTLVIAAYGLFVLWTFLSPAIGNLLLLSDRRARLALKRSEKLEGLTVGLTLCGGILVLVMSFIVNDPALSALGFGFLGASIPFASTFTNQVRVGRYLFGGIAALSLLAGILAAASHAELLARNSTHPVTTTAFWLVIASTWLANVRALRQ